MHSFNDFHKIVTKEIEELKFERPPRDLYEPIEYILSIGGKRLRPIVTLMVCELFEGNLDNAIYPALGMEMFHNFTLVHDDIMDNASVRRGKKTIHEKWDRNRAILSGDAMLILANKLMMNTEEAILKEVMEVYNSSGLLVCDGQQYDMNYESEKYISIEDYILMIELKTAALLSSCCKLGAVIAETNNKNKSLIEKFGHNLGISFQIEDDILDVYGDFSKFGKSIGGDILANKKTYLLVKAFEIANDNTKKELTKLFSDNNISDEQKISSVVKIYDDLDVLKHAREESSYYYKLTVEYLNNIEVDESRKANLYKLADNLINRDK